MTEITETEIKLAAHRFLDQRAIAYRRLQFSIETEKGAANVANALGFNLRQMVKTLIFTCDTGESVLIMVGADQNAVSANLKKAIGSRNISMAKPDVVLSTTGYEIGSIPPFHWQAPGFRNFLEASLMAEIELGVGAGQWGEEIIITPANLLLATGSQVVNLTDREKPVFS